MRIISKKAIPEFGKEHSDAVASLAEWQRIVVAAANWATIVDAKATFRNADFVGDKTVFNIATNRYRLIAFAFQSRVVYVKAILTHKEYLKETWKT